MSTNLCCTIYYFQDSPVDVLSPPRNEKLNEEEMKPNGKAPIPKRKFPSPNPNPGNPCNHGKSCRISINM